jgi:hypothetical protein
MVIRLGIFGRVFIILSLKTGKDLIVGEDVCRKSGYYTVGL